MDHYSSPKFTDCLTLTILVQFIFSTVCRSADRLYRLKIFFLMCLSPNQILYESADFYVSYLHNLELYGVGGRCTKIG